MDAIDRLIEAVERGEWPGGIDGAARDVFPYRSARADDRGLTAAEAFDGSLDAAHALHKALVPGWDWDVNNWSGAGVHPPKGVDGDWVFGNADTPARAWLLAILRAMKERGDTPEPPA